MTPTQGDSPDRCRRCAVPLRATRYELRAYDGSRGPRCLRCALLYKPMLLRSIIIAVVVGTILTAINQGNLIINGDFPSGLYWKVPLTYCVPFCVATAGALLNARTLEESL